MSDPFWAVLQPPPNESPADRDRRLYAELEAKRVSDGIDEMLRQERKELRTKQEVKILLLGQSESGKSTTLKREYLPSQLLSHFRCTSIVWFAPCSDSSFTLYQPAACVRRFRRTNLYGRKILPLLD